MSLPASRREASGPCGGIRVPSGGAPSFPKRVRALGLSEELASAVEPLLATHEQLCEQIKAIDAKIERAIKSDERATRLTTVPSVGAVTALTFIALVDGTAVRREVRVFTTLQDAQRWGCEMMARRRQAA